MEYQAGIVIGQFPLHAVVPGSWTAQKSQVESSEDQDDANINNQTFPESVSEEREIYTDYHGYHRHHVKHDSDLSAHFWKYSAVCFELKNRVKRIILPGPD
jgi:hypothetical protein